MICKFNYLSIIHLSHFVARPFKLSAVTTDVLEMMRQNLVAMDLYRIELRTFQSIFDILGKTFD